RPRTPSSGGAGRRRAARHWRGAGRRRRAASAAVRWRSWAPRYAMSSLRRSIGLGRATAMVVGTIIGASIFVQPSVITGEMRSVGGIVLVWTLAGLLTLAGALICAELASAYPLSGGVYVFLREAYSPGLGFLWGWAMFWSMHSGIIAAIAMVWARYVATLVPLGDLGIRLTAVAGIVVLSAINYVGVRPGSAVQTGLKIGRAHV